MSIPPVPPGLDHLRTAEVANRLHSIAIHLLRHARTADRDSGLTPERLSLLSVLAFAGPRTFSQLADAEGVSRPAITRIVKSLEAAGLVRREGVPGDRRQVVLNATAKGRKLMEAGRRRRVALIAQHLEPVGKRELEVLERASQILASLE